jgi:outer membrane protein TolC
VLGGFKEVLNLLSNQAATLRIAKAEIDRAKGVRRQALAAVLPTMTGTGSFTLQALQTQITTLNQKTGQLTTIETPASPTGQATLGVVQPFNARSYYGIGTADEQVEGTKLRYEDARRTAIAAAANAVVSVVTSERVAEINRVGLRSALERLELARRKKRLGSGTDLDVVRAEQDATNARAQIVTGDESLRKARESLGQIFNSTDAYSVSSSFSLNDIETAMKSACTVDKVENRTDVLAAKSDLKVAERAVVDARLQYAPTAQISSTLSVVPDALLATPGGQNATWSITALLTIPIWDGGSRYGAAKIASAQVEEAKVKVEQTIVGASIEATQAQRSVTVAEQARVVSEKARDLARETARLSQIAFETGAGTSLDLVTSGQALRQAELDLAVKELSVVQSKIAAVLALSKCDL